MNSGNILSTVKDVDHFNISGHVIYVKTKLLTGKEVYKIFESVKWANNKLPLGSFSIQIKSDRFSSSDILPTLELLMFYLGSNYPNLWKITFLSQIIVKRNSLFLNSLLKDYNGKAIGSGYVRHFNKKHYQTNYLRLYISLDEFLEDNKTVSAYCDDVFSFLKHTCLDEETCIDLFDVCSEVISNVFDHTESDCLIDIKFIDAAAEHKLLCINIISISNVYIGSKIVDLLDSNQLTNYSGSDVVLNALQYHSSHFSEKYDKSSFGFVCAFQNRVSTRNNSKQSGGTGLTTLIKRIHGKKTEDSYCSYFLSGDNMLSLNTQYLIVNKEGLIGFNNSNNFYTDIPNPSIIIKEKQPFPGTIFSVNLLF